MANKKAKIIKVGEVDGNNVSGWCFGDMEGVPIFTVTEDGEILHAGYSVDELRLVSNLGWNEKGRL